MVHLPNMVGDTIMALPALHGLAQCNVDLVLYGQPWIKDLLGGMPYPLKILPQRKVYQSYRQNQIKYSLLLRSSSFSAAFLSFLAGKKNFGYRGGLRSFFLTSSLPKTYCHYVEHFWRLAQFTAYQLGYSQNFLPLPPKITLTVSLTKQQAAKKLLAQLGIPSNFWILCPGATGKGIRGEEKIWPYWLEFSRRLIQKQIPVVACPGPNELTNFKRLLAPGVNIIEGLDLGIYAAIISQASQVIANDSGPMHIAAACETSVLGIFGMTDPMISHPWGGKFVGKKGVWPSIDVVERTLVTQNKALSKFFSHS